MTMDMFCSFEIAITSFPHSWLITRILTRVTRWVPLVEAGTAYLYRTPTSLSLFFSEISCCSIFSFLFVCLCLIFWSFFFWPLYCLPFELRLLITPLKIGIGVRNMVFNTTFNNIWVILWLWLLRRKNHPTIKIYTCVLNHFFKLH